MSRPDIHLEELVDRELDGTITDEERSRLADHRAACPACAAERALIDDFADDLEPAEGDEKILERALSRVSSGPHALGRKRRGGLPRHLRVVLVAAAVLLGFSAAAAIWTGVPQRIVELFAAGSEPSEDEPGEAQTGRAVVRAERPTAEPDRGEPAAEDAEEQEEELPAKEPADRPAAVALEARSVDRRSPSADAGASRGQGSRGESEAGTAEPVATPSTAGELFALANAARRAGRNDEAVAHYRTLGRAHPGSREEVTSRVSFGRLLLDRMGNAAEALPLFEGYLASAPAGPLAQEAMVGRASALQRLGRTNEERAAWRALLDAFPASIHAARARARLATLDGDGGAGAGSSADAVGGEPR